MKSFTELSKIFEERFAVRHFPDHTKTLYDPAQYILQLGGKRIRPVAVLMGNELFDEINPDAFHVAAAIELFHNFSLIHDDIMDKAPLRRGMETVHKKYGDSTALLAGDVMLIQAYEYINKIDAYHLQKVMQLFNKTAKEVCEGQQLDMDFESRSNVSLEEYVNMITLKTSVLLAASLQLGAILGGAREGSQQYLYEFGKNLGIAFQVQDDYLDAFGDPEKFGKQIGGDILANKKTFLMIHAMDTASPEQLAELNSLVANNPADKVEKVLKIFKDCKVDDWAKELKEKYLQTALKNLEDTPVVSSRKQSLADLAAYLIQREH
ncbi:polyprenyl synthetase family protein [Ferruginibacter lapsinanis]|uniref:polyprenyl synthetase family protein n=1 Tax=Ferruginibacter lapsinanis TaxID=563172 RepID=UPI001E31E3AE|nr:polyprenyl synthetase family protein [Ferruginibacter lapsinanis]UEG49187.1 polyprenyl synthetase family protein [Ferruginibacter lapsinanis]